jgi:GTP cyclohydrolase I
MKVAITKDNKDEITSYERFVKVEKCIKDLLVLIGEDPTRSGLKDTPERIARMYQELFKGYDPSKVPDVTTFKNGDDGVIYDEMIIDSGYFFSMCEHHMLPFFGHYYFAYIPNTKIIGLSKIARVVDYYSARLQVQERLTRIIVDQLQEALEPLAIGLVLRARHLCKEMRGIKKINGEMITSEMRGLFRLDDKARQEFLRLINNK